MSEKTDRMKFRSFGGTWASWEELFRQAAHFAGDIGREGVVSISHSADHADGIVTVWCWAA